MKNQKLLLFFVSLLTCYFAEAQNNYSLPFFDGFEETISNDATFAKWTTENLGGWQYWHLISGGGNGGQCMRFEVCDLDQNDWLITKTIDCTNVEQLAVNFDILYSGSGSKPKLFYTSAYNGNAAQSNWNELNYSLGTNNNEWHSVDEIVIDKPGNVIYFAFQYQAAVNQGIYCLLDNFSVGEYVSSPTYDLVGSSEHFEFYTNIVGESGYWLQIKDALEKNYLKYCGHWNIPDLSDFMDNNMKTQVYYTEKEHIDFGSIKVLDIKSGTFNRNNFSIFLSPLNTVEEINYYGNLENLAINTFAGYAVKHRIKRDGLEDYLPPYFIEGFGLYEQGYRPNRDSVISYLQNHSQNITHDDFLALKNFNANSGKDILTAYYEWSTLFGGYKGIYWQYGIFPETWKKFLYYFYTCSDEIQIKKYDQSENFDIYCSSRDLMYVDSMKVWLERTRAFYVDSFQMEINVRYPLLLMYDEQTGMDLTGYTDHFNGGSASICISPHSFWSGLDGYNWLLAHEFGHIFNSLMYIHFPNGFYHEGMANLSGYYMDGGAHLDDQWKIEYVFNYFQNTYNREPTLKEIIDNADAGKPGLEYGIDCYYFGFEFCRFLVKSEGFLKIREFFNNGLDWNVFKHPYDEIDKGYIAYLRQLNSERDYNEPKIVKNTGLTLKKGEAKIIDSSNLQASDQEVTDSKLFYVIETYPTSGKLIHLDKSYATITRFSESDLKVNKIQYVNEANEASTDYFTFMLTDGTYSSSNIRFDIQIIDSTYNFTDSSQYFVFSSNLENAQDYWNEISGEIDHWYLELCSYWDRPGTPFIFDPDKKLGITLTDEDSFQNQKAGEIPDWKCSFYDSDGTLVTKLPSEENVVYENSYSMLVKNTLGQYILNKHFNENVDQYFLEAFGLYYSGFRPQREEVLAIMDDLGRMPVLADIESINSLNNLQQKILAATYMEAKVLLDSYQGLYPGNETLWQNHLTYYYQVNDESRMGLHKPSVNFDFYCIPRDTIFLDTMAQRLESLFEHYSSLFELEINNRFNVIIFPDKETANGINGGEYSIGSAHGGDNFNMLSPYWSENSMQAASGGLVAHEFWHVIHFHMRPYDGYPNGYFIMEGMADYMPVGTHDMRTEPDLWKIEEVFYRYSNTSGREPNLGDIMGNPQTIEPYLFGQLFFNYLIPSVASYPDVKNFFLGRCDWSAFSTPYDQIDKGYIQYLKSLVNFIPYDTLVNIPFTEPFDNFYNGWSKPNFSNADNWQIDDGGTDGGKCAHFYTHSEENKAIESWMVTPALNAAGLETVQISFDYRTYGDNIELEVLFTDKFDGDINASDWTTIKKLPKPQNFDWENSTEIELINAPDSLFIAIRYLASGQQHQQAYIDNFEIKSDNSGELSTILTANATQVASTSATLNGNVTADGGSSITQRGFYWSTTNTSPGAADHVETVDGTTSEYSFSLTGLSPGTTCYFCAFATNSEGTATGEVKEFTTLVNLETMPLPFTDDFEDEDNDVFYKWTTENLEGWQYWHVIGWGGNGGPHCMRFEICDINQNDWLISKAIDCSSAEKLTVNFDILYSGNGQGPKLFYTSSYNGNSEQSNWTKLNYSLGPNQNEWHSVDEMVIDYPDDVIYFAFQYQAEANQGIYCLLDNFKVNDQHTASTFISLSENAFKIYPNPLRAESVVSFTNENTGHINIAIFDLHGNKIATIIDSKLQDGNHTIPIWNYIKSNGVYFCRLSTEKGTSTIKIVIDGNK